ncbi:hypothetical protein BC628DRAFT_1342970 [Trametes gibbosa]|nr:hypothetical protein BC628DRAFT_1342970 [Trametes gibbosa]
MQRDATPVRKARRLGVQYDAAHPELRRQLAASAGARGREGPPCRGVCRGGPPRRDTRCSVGRPQHCSATATVSLSELCRARKVHRNNATHTTINIGLPPRPASTARPRPRPRARRGYTNQVPAIRDTDGVVGRQMATIPTGSKIASHALRTQSAALSPGRPAGRAACAVIAGGRSKGGGEGGRRARRVFELAIASAPSGGIALAAAVGEFFEC